ncbi:MAG: hypothetical protein JRN21_05825 [Nitrososphaerota archaeon]|nr:hypothetical protein [Nitrososphaerota archaeon]
MRDARKFVLDWLAAVSIITLAIVPVRFYLFSGNDWLVGAVSVLALAFVVAYFLVARLWKPSVVGLSP